MMILGFFQLRNCFCFSGIQISFERGRIRTKMRECMGIRMIHGKPIYASHAEVIANATDGKKIRGFPPWTFRFHTDFKKNYLLERSKQVEVQFLLSCMSNP